MPQPCRPVPGRIVRHHLDFIQGMGTIPRANNRRRGLVDVDRPHQAERGVVRKGTLNVTLVAAALAGGAIVAVAIATAPITGSARTAISQLSTSRIDSRFRSDDRR